MSLDKSTLERVAYLARIKIEDSEINKMTTELNNIMKWIEELNEVDIENVSPMIKLLVTHQKKLMIHLQFQR